MMLAGRTALVTGAGRRLGRTIALALAARGARVAVHYRASAVEAAAVVETIRAGGGHAERFAADLGAAGAAHRLAEEVAARLGPVDVLVNNASVFRRTPLATLDEPQWDEHLLVNLKAPYLLSLQLGRAMRERGAGKIVNVTDSMADRPHPDFVPYAVSKAALGALTRGLARALAPEVQVNGVAPGPILPPAGATEAERARIVQRTPLGRFGEPADVAAVVVFLVEAGDFITGSTLSIDGGRALD